MGQQETMNRHDPRLSTVLGLQVPVRLNARRIAALADNPACRRRTVLDVSGVDGVHLSAAAGIPAKFGQSPFAMVRGRGFEASILADHAHALGVCLAAHFDVPARPFRVIDISAPTSGTTGGTAAQLLPARVAATRRAITALLDGSGPPSLVVHPVLTLTMPAARSAVYLEPDALALTAVHDGQLICVEIKSHPVIDGVVDPAAAASAARQIAVYVYALRALLVELGEDPGRVSTRALLVTPRNTSKPVGHAFEASAWLASLSRQLDRISRVGSILDGLPAGFTLDPDLITQTVAANAPESVRVAAVAAEIRRLPANYVPSCRSTCQLGEFCHRDAVDHGDPGLLGAAVRDQLAGVADLYAAARIAGRANTLTASVLTDDEQALLSAALADYAVRGARLGTG